MSLAAPKPMNAANYFNDAPIVSPEDDRFGIDAFATALAQSIRGIKSPIGTAIAINGIWGSGKTSAANLIRHHLEPELANGSIKIIDYKCWWFRGEEALTLSFLQELHSALSNTLGKRAKEYIPKIGRTLLQTGPVIGPAANVATGLPIGKLISGGLNFTKRFFPDYNVESLFAKLSKALESQTRRFIVIIDDIDRLTPEESLLIFRLVKSVGRLPNIIYLLIFDRKLAQGAVNQMYPTEGPHFLEKIIQASFEIPLPTRDDLNSASLASIDGICGPLESQESQYRMLDVFHEVISPYLRTPRDLTRLSNSLSVVWPAVRKEVNPADFVALEAIRLFEAELYNAIRSSKDEIVGVDGRHDSMRARREDKGARIERLVQNVGEGRREISRTALTRLFPRLENVGYSSDFLDKWDAERLICSPKHFDTYFRLTVGEESMPAEEVEEFINNAADKSYVQTKFLDALTTIRRSGKSLVPTLFDEINVRSDNITDEVVEPLLSALFEISDKLSREGDREKGSLSIGDNRLRLHWLLRKLTLERFDIDKRTAIFLAACENASLGWLVDFSSSAYRDYYPKDSEKKTPPERCLVTQNAAERLKDTALGKIRESASEGSLIDHDQLGYLLFRWRDFENSDAVKAWTNVVLGDDESVALLAQAFTGETWTHTFGSSISVRADRAQIDGLEDIIDVARFRKRLEEIEHGKGAGRIVEPVSRFLNAWRRRESGDD